jgi:hypothetical protein
MDLDEKRLARIKRRSARRERKARGCRFCGGDVAFPYRVHHACLRSEIWHREQRTGTFDNSCPTCDGYVFGSDEMGYVSAETCECDDGGDSDKGPS